MSQLASVRPQNNLQRSSCGDHWTCRGIRKWSSNGNSWATVIRGWSKSIMLLKLLVDRKSESILPPRVSSLGKDVMWLRERRPHVHRYLLSPGRCVHVCQWWGCWWCWGWSSFLPLGGQAVTTTAVFIVHTLPGVQSKHAVRYHAERGQEANLFICQLLGE